MVVLSEICIKSSWYPIWEKEEDEVTTCYSKQNLVAEVMTALISFDEEDGGSDYGGQSNDNLHAPDNEGLQKNVRFAYIKVDANGATVDISLNDQEFNYYPVPKEVLVDTFVRIENEDCGAGTDDVIDLCSGLDAAIAEFENNQLDETRERERKIAIISNNKHNEMANGEYVCANGENLCNKYEPYTVANGDGISIVMINIDMNGAVDEYLPCLEKFVLFKGKNQRILVAVFFKRIIFVNLEENLKNKISDFRLSNIIHFCYCILFFHFLDQYVCMDVNFVWIISSFL
jgi:hypothetical protein